MKTANIFAFSLWGLMMAMAPDGGAPPSIDNPTELPKDTPKSTGVPGKQIGLSEKRREARNVKPAKLSPAYFTAQDLSAAKGE